MDEIWINYCGMPICFGLQEFSIVTGLRCYRPEEPPIAKGTPRKRSKERKYKEKIDGLFDIARHGYKASDLLTDLMDKNILKKYREKLCLVWFAHLVILARDINKVIEDDLLACAEDFDKFNNYPWGYDSFYLTVQYLLTKLTSGTTTLYGFSWAFMVWAFKAIPPLRK
ncbi:putative glycerol-3-phosphate 2-O-acyltransferase 6-like [Capsicum annuum]|nr:putative glycerol-3-phosphate 2-O-acyltransferase 6-like [Capsicum annuum]KAF3655076.1 putative glycerol-3-phosphate 2-O-acyltransferase 6-like [Capsicum annuum]